MNTTLRHISHLLRSCDLLVVPGLGVFSRRRIEAHISNGVFMAPSAEISFLDIQDDDSNRRELVMSLARSLAIEPVKAEMRMRDEIAELRQLLSAGRSVTIPDVGILSQNGSHITLEAFASANARPWLSWLGGIEPIEEAQKNTYGQEDIEENRRTFLQSLRRTTSSAAAIALLALIAFVASQLPGRPSDDPTREATMGIEHIDSHAREALPIENPLPEKALVLIVHTPSDGMSIVEPRSEVSAKPKIPERNVDDRYFLIVASLASRDEARHFIESQNNDIKLDLLEEDGRFRVYATSGKTFATTKATADRCGIFEHYPQAWICKSVRQRE